MDRAETTGIGVSLVGHAALLAIFALGFASVTRPPPVNQPMEVSFVKDIGLTSAVSEPAVEPPAQSVAAEIGAPEEAAPQAEAAPAPPAPAPPAPQEVAEPTPKRPSAPPADPRARARRIPDPKREQPSVVRQLPTATKNARTAERSTPTKAATSRQAQANAAGQAERTRGSRLGKDFLKGIGMDETPSRAQRPTGAVMSAQAMTGIVAAIQRQVQPCADRQVNPGPGASRITVKLNLKLNRDGSLAARPRVVSFAGVDDENDRYQDRVADLAIAAFTGCAPLRDLPADLYQTSAGGWSNFNMNYKLPA